MTKARQSILDFLLQVKEPVSASDLAKQLEHACDPATVYRNLHYLEDHNLATSLSCTVVSMVQNDITQHKKADITTGFTAKNAIASSISAVASTRNN